MTTPERPSSRVRVFLHFFLGKRVKKGERRARLPGTQTPYLLRVSLGERKKKRRKEREGRDERGVRKKASEQRETTRLESLFLYHS